MFDRRPDAASQPAEVRREAGREAGAGIGRAVVAMTAVCAVLVAVTAVVPLVRLPLRLSDDYGEGWNAYWAAAAVDGLPLYSRTHVLVADNYPPLSFYLVGWLGRLVGDQIVAGRMVATASLVAVALLIAHILVRAGAARRWAAIAALLFGLYNLFFFRNYVAVDNPQWLAEAVMLAGVLPLLGRAPAALGWRRLSAAAVLMVLAGLVKHDVFALPATVTLWLLLFDRAALLVWCAAGLVLASLACALLWLGFGDAVFAEIVGFGRTLSLDTFRSALTTTSSLSALIAVGALSLWRERRRPDTVLFGLFAGLGVLSGLGQRLGNGVNVNAQFDALIGLVILCGLLLGRGGGGGAVPRPLGPEARALLLFALLVPPLISAPKRVGGAVRELSELPREAAGWRNTIAAVRDVRGPVLCEYLAACFWAGKPEVLDFFAYGEKLRRGSDPGSLAALVASRTAGMIVLVDRGGRSGRWIGEQRLPPPFPALIGTGYRVLRAGPAGMELMVPRQPAAPNG